ncbi:hypothetical protein [Streptomyces sp. NBC_01190]|uniref:hypothetical protein n=1 Tax=Streptomyces sp. NBC_01190 TaxID=2903767 RepID=UPI00386910D1|nr:hypothetical protein OG519_32845 [Streptomyces sp. NBC_01190]
MAGKAGDAGIADDTDALFVLTAAMLTPGRYPGVLGDDYPSACAELDLAPVETGYGLVFGQDGAGVRWTVATTDTATVACALAAWDCGLAYDLSPDENSLAASLPGWPLPVAVAAPGVPAPHDPDEGTAGRPPLAPPDASVWGPAQRRMGADEIAVRWHEWRGRSAPESASRPDPAPEAEGRAPAPAAEHQSKAPSAELSTAPAAPAAPATPDTEPTAPAAAQPPAISHSGVRRALAAAEEYLRRPPPAGRVRSVHGAVRADGPGWSLVARIDDMAFVLLDEAPGTVLPVGRGTALPALLEALGKLAATPAPAPAPPADPGPPTPATATAPSSGPAAAVTPS